MNRQLKRQTRRLNRAARIKRIKRELEAKGEFLKQRNFVHHGNTSVYTHVTNVGWWAHRIADFLPVKIDKDSLVKGALLHDYFLYDWHEPGHKRPHGFTHPKIASKNAHAHFGLSDKEKDMIEKHMWPLTPAFPKHKESWIVTFADKIATFEETVGKRRTKRKAKNYIRIE